MSTPSGPSGNDSGSSSGHDSGHDSGSGPSAWSGPDPGSAPQPGWGPPPGWEAPPPWYGPPPGYGPPAQWYGGPGAGPQSSDDTTWAVLAHLSYFVAAILAPLVIYLVKKDSSPYVRQQAAEALNFQLTLTIAAIVSLILILVAIGILMLFAVFVLGIVFTIIAAVAAGKGEPYRYPMTIRFVH